MVVEEIAADIIVTIVPLITKKISGKLAEKAEGIYKKIKEKFSNDPDAYPILKNVEKQPTSTVWQAALGEVLTEKMKEDPSFAEEIKKLLKEAKEVPGFKSGINVAERAVYAGGNVSNNFIIAGDHVNVSGEVLKKINS